VTELQTRTKYTYDALGYRVHKSGTGMPRPVEYVYDLAGRVMAEYDGGCTGGVECNWADYIYLGGQLVAEYENSTTYFPISDHLGSMRVLTGMNQAVVQNLDYYPYGALNSTDSGVTTHKFTGDERDIETGLDHTEFRNYSSSLGRWMTPDPAGLSAVDPANPQSWNRYSYALNNPLRFVDPTGLTCYAKDEDGNITDDITDPEIDNARDCADSGDNGGVWLEVDTTVLVTADNSGNVYSSTYWNSGDNWGYLDSGGFSWTPSNSMWNRIKSAARTVGNYIPTFCGGGVFNYGGFRLSGAVASVSVSQIRMADTRSGYSEAPFADISFGEVLMGGYGQAFFGSGENEHFLFGGVGGDVGITKASLSLFGSHVSGTSILQNSIGLNGDAGFSVLAGGVGVYLNTDSLTSCIDHDGW
jgi:RHS repeat-associated protein